MRIGKLLCGTALLLFLLAALLPSFLSAAAPPEPAALLIEAEAFAPAKGSASTRR